MLFYLGPVEQTGKLGRQVPKHVQEHISVTPSALLSQHCLHWALEVPDPDRINQQPITLCTCS